MQNIVRLSICYSEIVFFVAVLLDFFISNSFQKTKGDLLLRLLCRSPMTMPDPLLLFVGVVALCLEGVEGLDGEDDLDLAAPMTV